MTELSALDRRLITVLKKDARASVTNLASLLGVARATIQSRLGRLVTCGVIRRFTIELDTVGQVESIHAVMMIELTGNLARSVIKVLKAMPEIVTLHTTNGAWDLVAYIETADLREFDRILREVREISGVLNSDTCILLNTAKD